MSESTDCRIEVIIDGDSVAHDGMQTPSTAHLRCASYWLRDNRDVVKGTIVIGPKLRHEISCSWDLDDMVNKGYVKQCPAGYKADTFILEFARLHPRAFIISKDLYRDYRGTRLEIDPSRLWGFMIVGRDFLVPDFADELEKKHSSGITAESS